MLRLLATVPSPSKVRQPSQFRGEEEERRGFRHSERTGKGFGGVFNKTSYLIIEHDVKHIEPVRLENPIGDVEGRSGRRKVGGLPEDIRDGIVIVMSVAMASRTQNPRHMMADMNGRGRTVLIDPFLVGVTPASLAFGS